MKRLVSFFVAVAFAAGTAGIVSAQTPPAAPPEKKMDGEKKMEKTEKKAEKADKKMASKTVKGTVKSAAADSIVVAGKEKGKDAEWTVAIDAKTKIKKGGKDATPADVKAGDSVSVKVMEHEGKNVAQTVTVTGGGMAKKDEMKPAAEKK